MWRKSFKKKAKYIFVIQILSNFGIGLKFCCDVIGIFLFNIDLINILTNGQTNRWKEIYNKSINPQILGVLAVKQKSYLYGCKLKIDCILRWSWPLKCTNTKLKCLFIILLNIKVDNVFLIELENFHFH